MASIKLLAYSRTYMLDPAGESRMTRLYELSYMKINGSGTKI